MESIAHISSGTLSLFSDAPRASAATAVLLPVYGEFGANLFGSNLVKRLLAVPPKEPIELDVDCVGGSVWDAAPFYEALKKREGKKTAYITGVCASMATCIAMACDEVKMSRYGVFMVHAPASELIARGDMTAAEIEDKMTYTRALTEEFVTNYMKRFKGTEEELRAMMKEERKLTASQALGFGFITSIMGDGEQAERMTKVAAVMNMPKEPIPAHNIPSEKNKISHKPAEDVLSPAFANSSITAMMTFSDSQIQEMAKALQISADELTADMIVGAVVERQSIMGAGYDKSQDEEKMTALFGDLKRRSPVIRDGVQSEVKSLFKTAVSAADQALQGYLLPQAHRNGLAPAKAAEFKTAVQRCYVEAFLNAEANGKSQSEAIATASAAAGKLAAEVPKNWGNPTGANGITKFSGMTAVAAASNPMMESVMRMKAQSEKQHAGNK